MNVLFIAEPLAITSQYFEFLGNSLPFIAWGGFSD